MKDEESKLFVYTSDTGFFGRFQTVCKSREPAADGMFVQKNKPVAKHLELADAMRLAHQCAPEKLVLTHLYPEWDGIDVAAEARALWSGETMEAKDGLKVEIQDD